MAGCAFRRAAEEILGDFGAEFSKTKTLGAGVRIFNGAVRAEREFPLKILFFPGTQGFVVLLFQRNRDQILPTPFLNTISVYSVSKYFRTFIPLHAADKFKYSSETEIPSVVLLDQPEVFQYNISHLFIRHIKDFFFNQPVANGFCLR